MVQMATITKRRNPSGETVYRVQVRVGKKGYPAFNESRTFSKKALAVEWGKKREAEIEAGPELLFKRGKVKMMTLSEAMRKYLNETLGAGRSKKMGLRFLMEFPIGGIGIDKLKRSDFAGHVMQRRRGIPELDIAPIAASTALQELQYIRSVLKHAFYVWGLEIGWQELDFAANGLKRSNMVAKSAIRDRLPTTEELQTLTTYFLRQWQSRKSSIPMHLIMWLAIYTSRRQDEICRLLFDDWHKNDCTRPVRDLKNPNGSTGNNKEFDILPMALPVIDELPEESVRKRMLANKGIADSLVPCNGKSVSAAWTRACKVLGIKDLRFHDLRHEAATRMAEDGFTIPQMQRVTLHDGWNSLQRYVSVRKRSTRLDFKEAMMQAQSDIKSGK